MLFTSVRMLPACIIKLITCGGENDVFYSNCSDVSMMMMMKNHPVKPSMKTKKTGLLLA